MRNAGAVGLGLLLTVALSSCPRVPEQPGGGTGGDGGAGSGNAVEAKKDALLLRIDRKSDRFRIEIEGVAEAYGNGPGTYVVFVPEASFQKAIKLTHATPASVSRRSSGNYDTPPADDRALKALTLSIDVISSVAQGEGLLEAVELAGALVGIEPITSPSQLPEIALALGEKYVNAVGEANIHSEPFGKLLSILSGGQPGVLLVSGKGYWIDVVVNGDPATMGINVDLQYTHSPLLPSGLPMQQALTKLLLGHQVGRPVAISATASASLPPLQAKEAPKPSGPSLPKLGKWQVKGADVSGNTLEAVLVFTQNVDERTNSGYFDWTSDTGLGGLEHFKGTFDPNSRTMRLTGYRLENPVGIILGRYEAELSPDGLHLLKGKWDSATSIPGIPGTWTADWVGSVAP